MTKLKTKWDSIGILISGLCIIHCIAIPIALIAFPLMGSQILPSEDMTHAVLLGFILGVAGIAFFSGYRVHGKFEPVLWMAAGVLLVVFATFFVHNTLGHMAEPIFAIAGSLALIRAHILNHRCKKCDHPNHD